MPGQQSKFGDSDQLLDALLALIPKPFLSRFDKLWARAEVARGVGSADLYVQTPDGRVLHLQDERELVGSLFDCVYGFATTHSCKETQWSTATLRWQRGHPAELGFGHEGVEDRGNTSQRRTMWEKSEFGNKLVERLDTF